MLQRSPATAPGRFAALPKYGKTLHSLARNMRDASQPRDTSGRDALQPREEHATLGHLRPGRFAPGSEGLI